MSLRKQAKILGISPTYLSLILSGRRPWRGNLKERYLELVNTFVNTPRANATPATGYWGLTPEDCGGNDKIRTCDLALMKRPLCR